jgi:hypothetical protein
MAPLVSTEVLAAWTHDKDVRATTTNRTDRNLKCTQPAALHPPRSVQRLSLATSSIRGRQPAGPFVLRLPKPDTRASLSCVHAASLRHPLALYAQVPTVNAAHGHEPR